MPAFAPIRTYVVGPARAIIRDSLTQDMPYGTVETSQLVRRQGVCPTPRMKPSLKQGLVHIDVPQAGDEPLIQQQWLDHPSTVVEKSAEVLHSEVFIQRLRPQAPQDFLGVGHQIEASELAHVHEAQFLTIVQPKTQASMGLPWSGGLLHQ